MVAQRQHLLNQIISEEEETIEDRSAIRRFVGKKVMYEKPSGGLSALILCWVQSRQEKCIKLSTEEILLLLYQDGELENLQNLLPNSYTNFWKLLLQADKIGRFKSGRFLFRNHINSWTVGP